MTASSLSPETLAAIQAAADEAFGADPGQDPPPAIGQVRLLMPQDGTAGAPHAGAA